MMALFCAFLFSLLISGVIVRSNFIHGRYTNDVDFDSVQKFHVIPVSRIGGVAILLALAINWLFIPKADAELSTKLSGLLLACIPIFTVGLLEDVTKKISARARLYFSFISAAVIYFIADIHFTRVDYHVIDHWLAVVPLFSFVMTLLVIAGAIHAMNMIDGFNGLMLGVSLFAFAAIAYVGYTVQDMLVLKLSFICFGAIAGLFVVNFPLGKIFAGDSGAYLVGFLISTMVLMLVQRNPAVSAWFPCLLLIYPIFETLFSIYRKVFIRKMTAMQPDGIHLHMLIHKRLMRNRFLTSSMNNSMTSPYLWGLSLLGIIPAALFWDSRFFSMLFCALFVLIYLRIYWYLVWFKDPIGFLRYFKVEIREKSIKETL